MPAALGLRTVRARAGAPPGQDAAFGRASALTLDDAARGTQRLPWLMMSAPWFARGENNRHGPRGEQEKCTLPNGINASARRVANDRVAASRARLTYGHEAPEF